MEVFSSSSSAMIEVPDRILDEKQTTILWWRQKYYYVRTTPPAHACSRAQNRFTQGIQGIFVGHLGLCGRSVDCSVLRRPLPLIMSSRTQNNKGQKQNANQTILSELLKEEENRYCADCAAKGKLMDVLRSHLFRQRFCSVALNYLYFLVSNLACFSFYRAALGVMESGRFSLYSLCRYTSKLRSSHIESEICEPWFMDSRANGSKL